MASTSGPMFMEEDDSFAAQMAEAEEQDIELPPSSSVPPSSAAPPSRQPLKAYPWSNPSEAMKALDEMAVKRADVREGKKRMISEEPMDADDEFGEETFELSRHATPPPPKRNSNHSYSDKYADLSSVNLNYIRPGFINAAPLTVTTLSGKKIVLKRSKRLEGYSNSKMEARENTAALTALSSSMLEKPYHEMKKDIVTSIALAKKQRDADDNAAFIEPPPVETTLWTDRYRPNKFIDLLGDERVHRSALLWLKEWDQCVFKGAKNNSAAAELKRARRKKRAREGKYDQGEEERAPDQFGRPFEKIMLLCGPPGLGKTTLAYVLAKQAGYQVLEINASDDRNAKVVTERIKNALESTALTASGGLQGSKPTCVVIDEIDGAGGGGDTSFVKSLLKLVLDGSSNRKYKGKAKQDRPLLRPIICICNDLYAPTLRPLRPLAKIIRFTPPTNVMLVHRLRTICDEEGLGADAKNLTMLTEIAEGDLRSCLNTLQFIKRKSTVVDEHAIKSTMVGMKDTGTSVSAVWDSLFKKPARKKGGGGTSDDRYLNRLVKVVQTCGEYDKISQGVFENYLGAKQTGDDWTRILEVHDWLHLYDRLDGRLNADRDYELMAYLPYTFVPWYKLFSSHTAKPLEFPKADYEAYLQRTAHKEIAEAFALTLPHSLRTMFSNPTIASELLPLLNRIIAPDLKPINSQLIKKEERTVMMSLIQNMMTMKLSFVHDKNEEGQLSYKLDPPIDVFVHYEGKRATDIAPSRYAVRHMIAREMTIESDRRGGGGDVAAHTARDIINAYQLKPKNDTIVEVKDAVDFFGRTITTKPKTAEEEALPTLARKKQKAVYKFHEGFSNAVKVTKRISDFL